jgi:L-fuculose-phosphate aldolase
MNASTVAAARREVPPILDDMAQIIGPTVRVAPYALSGTKKIVRVTVRALKGRNAVLMANHGAVCVGRNLDEAFVVCEILEKACKAFIEAEFLGGAKHINKFEAYLMHQYYLRKYSKQDQKNR